MVTVYEKATSLIITGDDKELKQIRSDLEFRPTGYHYAPSYQRYVLTKGKEGWDGWIRPLQLSTKNSAAVPRGYKQDIIGICRMNGFKLNLDNCLSSPFAGLTLDDIPADCLSGGLVLDDSQRQNVLDWLVEGMGIHKVTVGGGKTATAAGTIRILKNQLPQSRIIYITQSERLVRQCYTELKRFLPHLDIGQMGGGRNDENAEDVVVCTVAMLNRHFRPLYGRRWFSSFDAVLFDECHHAASDSAQKILNAIPAYFRWGMTDTAKEDDPGKFNAIKGVLGPRLNEVKAAALFDSGRLARPHIYIVSEKSWIDRFDTLSQKAAENSTAHYLVDGKWHTGLYRGPVYQFDDEGKPVLGHTVMTKEVDDDGVEKLVRQKVHLTQSGLHKILDAASGEVREIDSKWCLLNRAYDKAVIGFKERNRVIRDWAKAFSDSGRRTVIVCTRTLHVYILEAMLLDVLSDDRVEVMTGEASSTRRDETFDWIKRTPGGVLITPLVKEGVSINELDAGIVADYVADHEAANQIIGRFMRSKREGENRADVVWFRENQHPGMRRGCNRMFKRLVQLEGYRFYDPAPSPEEWLKTRAARR